MTYRSEQELAAPEPALLVIDACHDDFLVAGLLDPRDRARSMDLDPGDVWAADLGAGGQDGFFARVTVTRASPSC